MEINCFAKEQIAYIKNKCDFIKPLVVIRCITYNHEAYIRDALEGFVAQKTDFPFVAIIHDDASTDNTTTIIKKYSTKYPNIILPILEKENLYSKKDGEISMIINTACDVTGAKYVAVCEGDDYWIDPFKLQKQVDFLESHPDYSMCFHTVDIKNEGISKSPSIVKYISERDYSAEEVLDEWIIPTCSVLLKKNCLIDMPYSKDFIVGDNVLWASCLTHGKIRGLIEKMGVYRRIQSGWTNRASSSKNIQYITLKKWISHYQAMTIYFKNIDRQIFENKIIEHMAKANAMELYLLKGSFFQNFQIYYKEYGCKFTKQLLITLGNSLKVRLKRLCKFRIL